MRIKGHNDASSPSSRTIITMSLFASRQAPLPFRVRLKYTAQPARMKRPRTPPFTHTHTYAPPVEDPLQVNRVVTRSGYGIPGLDSFAMLPVLQMNLKVLDRGPRSGRVELTRAIVTAETWKPLKFGLRWKRRLLKDIVG